MGTPCDDGLVLLLARNFIERVAPEWYPVPASTLGMLADTKLSG